MNEFNFPPKVFLDHHVPEESKVIVVTIFMIPTNFKYLLNLSFQLVRLMDLPIAAKGPQWQNLKNGPKHIIIKVFKKLLRTTHYLN